MHKLSIDDRTYYLKSSWSEFTKAEFLKVSYLRSQNITASYSQIEFNAARITLFTELSNVPIVKTLQIDDQQWVDLLPYLNYCFKEPDLNTNLLPFVGSGFNKLFGPIGMLDKSTMFEMTQADTAFTSASNGKDLDKMYLLAAILYRPKRIDLSEFKASKNWNGDIREPFNITRCKERIPLFKKLPAYYITAIFLYYWAFRVNKLMQFKRIFKQASGNNKGTNRGWAGTLLEMSHLPVFGNLDKTGEQNWFTVTYEMDRQLELQEKREAELESRK